MPTTTNEKIHRQMTIDDILAKFPYKAQKLTQELTNAGLHCVGCHAATWETLEGGMLGHGLPEEAIDTLVDRLNALLEEKESDPTMISMTNRAAKKYQDILREEGKEGWGLHFAEAIGGCNGVEYVLDYAEKASPEETTFESHGVCIFVPTKMVKRLIGSEIDYVDGLTGAGFKISNPKVKSSCSCGNSHGY